MERERSRSLTVPPGALPPYGGAPDDEGKQVATIDRSSAALRAIWARPWLDDEAADRAAFLRKATGAGADTAEIFAGAQQRGPPQSKRFRQLLKKWLDARGWEKPPPKRRERREACTRGDVHPQPVVNGIIKQSGKTKITAGGHGGHRRTRSRRGLFIGA